MTTATLSFIHDHALIRFARRVKTCSDASTLYQMLLSEAQYLIPCQRAMLYLFHEQTQELFPVASCSGSVGGEAVPVPNVQTQDEMPGRISIRDTNSIVAWAAKHRHPLLHRPAQTSFDHSGNGQLSEIAVPLIARNMLWGVLVLQHSKPFHRQELRNACDLCNLAVSAIANMELSQRFHTDQEQLRAILATIAHELRSPLNTVNGYLELALSGAGGELNTQQREFVQRARMGSEHLYALLENLLLISRADVDQLRLNRDIISLSPVVADAVEELELTAADHSITIKVEIPERFPRLYADAVRLQQVVRNLVSNALRFTPSGGQVIISARVETLTQEIDSDELVQVIKLQIRDTGVGIAPELHERIFERFFQLPREYERRAGGQGLGLAVVKMIVELHNGSVKVESVPGEGSTFTCTLPCLLS
ncbi:MAG TPA: GAF domain-containing sensor histidine kinase [Ktedonobacteraceae bacterium]